jgi:hypothetical protein
LESSGVVFAAEQLVRASRINDLMHAIELLSENAVRQCRPFAADDLDRFWAFISKRGLYARYDIRSNVPYGPDSRLLRFLRSVAEEFSIPDTSFIYYQQDCLPDFGLKIRVLSLFYHSIPIFVSAKKLTQNDQVLFCDWHYDPTETNVESWNGMVQALSQPTSSTQWGNKIDKLIWRGGPNDGCYTPSTVNRFPRGRLVALGREYPKLIDASFNNYPPNFVEHREFFQRNFQAEFVSPAKMASYKYQVDIDGVTATFSSLSWKLLSGSLVFKQDSPNKTWFHDLLVPWKHYIPLQKDLGDLMDKLAWAKENDGDCRAIAESGRELALNFLLPDNLKRYCFHVLVNYAKLFKNN